MPSSALTKCVSDTSCNVNNDNNGRRLSKDEVFVACDEYFRGYQSKEKNNLLGRLREVAVLASLYQEEKLPPSSRAFHAKLRKSTPSFIVRL